jgi:hypothetical protein
MRNLIRVLILGSVVALSACVVVPAGGPHYYHCGYYHCR